MNDQEFLDYTRKVWEPAYGRELSDEELYEIMENSALFLEILMEWYEEELLRKKPREKVKVDKPSLEKVGCSE